MDSPVGAFYNSSTSLVAADFTYTDLLQDLGPGQTAPFEIIVNAPIVYLTTPFVNLRST